MTSRKRSRQSGVDDAEGLVKLADGDSLAADLVLVRACSSCARCLPADTNEWDLSGLLIDGTPVQRTTVEAWLSCVDTAVHGAVQSGSKPMCPKGALTDAAGLYQLLSFADAVGSSGGVLTACLQELWQLHFEVTVAETNILCHSNASCFVFSDKDLVSQDLIGDESEYQHSFESAEEVQEFCQKLSAQIEALLYIGHKLQLQRLLQLMHIFIFKCFTLPNGILQSKLHMVFSDRVLSAALGTSSSNLVRNAYISSVLAPPCDTFGGRQLLQPLGAPKLVGKDLQFKALVKDPSFFGYNTYEGEVDVRLSLFNSDLGKGGATISFDQGPAFRLRLLLGDAITDQRDFDQLVASHGRRVHY
jgi:hypothetical protein